MKDTGLNYNLLWSKYAMRCRSCDLCTLVERNSVSIDGNQWPGFRCRTPVGALNNVGGEWRCNVCKEKAIVSEVDEGLLIVWDTRLYCEGSIDVDGLLVVWNTEEIEHES